MAASLFFFTLCLSGRSLASMPLESGEDNLAGFVPPEAEALPQAEEYGGMGGADTPFPDSQLEALFEASEAPLELYYELYTVQRGDTILDIAGRFGVSQDAIISINSLRSTRSLQVGQILKIPSIDGILYTARKGDTPESIAEVHGISLRQIAAANSLPDSRIEEGFRLFLPGARLDKETLLEIDGEHFRNPLRSNYIVSSSYGWRKNPFSGRRTFHKGVDMACPSGTPIYATMAGDVIEAGYNSTYGNYVTIRHHSGYESMYAHMSQILVSPGSRVTSETRIGLVGSTGQSTGPHLHFAVLKNNSSANPLLLWD